MTAAFLLFLFVAAVVAALLAIVFGTNSRIERDRLAKRALRYQRARYASFGVGAAGVALSAANPGLLPLIAIRGGRR